MKIKLLTLLLIGCLAAPVLADDKQEKSDAKQKSSVLAITGGDIHTVTNGVIRQGTVLVKDGKIAEVGSDVAIPEGAQVIDATGKIVSPGFVAISMSGLGVSSNPSGSNKLSDSLDPFDQNLKYALGVGITSGCVEMTTDGGRGRRRSPGEPEDIFPGLEQPIESRLTEEMLDYGDPNTALCPCCGLPVLPTEPITPQAPSTAKPRTITVIKMAYGNLDAMLGKEDVFYNPAPGALNGPLNRHNWRIELEKAGKAIAEEKKKASEAANKKPAESKSSTEKSGDAEKKPATNARSGGASNKDKADEDVVKLLKGETTMRVRADSYDEISDLTDLALEYGYGLVIEGGTEAWALADKLSIAGVEVIYTPRSRREPVEGREDNSGSHFESPRIFEDKGIPFATKSLSSSISMGGLAGRDLTSLPLEAAFAVRGGASEKTALESITIAPAKMMGMEDRIGSIEVGKDADLLILNGEPLDYKTYVEQAIVQGKVAYQRDEDRVYPVYEREQ